MSCQFNLINNRDAAEGRDQDCGNHKSILTTAGTVKVKSTHHRGHGGHKNLSWLFSVFFLVNLVFRRTVAMMFNDKGNVCSW